MVSEAIRAMLRLRQPLCLVVLSLIAFDEAITFQL
jgi:hypothetical protein